MKIGIDITGLFWKYRTGVQNYYYGLIAGLANLDLDGKDVKFVLVDRSIQDVHHFPFKLNNHFEFRRAASLQFLPTLDVLSSTRFWGRGIRVWNRGIRGLRRRIAQRQKRVDRMLKDLDVLQVWNWDIRLAPRAKHVITVPDVIPVLFPELYTPEFVKVTKESLEFAKNEAHVVIAISKHTKRDLINIAGIPEEKIRVIYYGVHKIFRPIHDSASIRKILQRYGINNDRPYILSVGFLDPRKNVKGHVRAFEKLVMRNKDMQDLQLVLVGPKSLATDQVLQEVDLSRVRERIYITDYVPHHHIPFIISGASAFVYCSFYEGFGLPVIEAMACGVPVVTSNSSSLAEIAKDAAILVDPYDVDAIVMGLYRVLTDTHVRSELISCGLSRANQFRWEKAAREHLRVYRECLIGGI